MVGAVMIIWWSLQRVVPVRAEVGQVASEVARLRSDLVAKERQLETEGGAAAIEDGYTQARSLLLAGRPGVEAWLHEVRSAADSLGLDLKVTFGAPTRRDLTNQSLAVVPATLVIGMRPEAGGNDTPYALLIKLAQCLFRTPCRVDLISLSASGTSGCLDSARLAVRLWSTDLSGEALPAGPREANKLWAASEVP